jgi:hypothetical protein
MKHITALLALLLIIQACSSEEKNGKENTSKENTEIDTTQVDSVQIDTVVEVQGEDLLESTQKLLSKFGTEYQIPFSIDTTNISEMANNENEGVKLSFEQLENLADTILAHNYSQSISYNIKKYGEFEKMKEEGGYENYVNSIDIGMMKDIHAFLVGKIVIDETTYILLWSIDYASYEACPYYSAEIICGTLITENKIQNCSILGELSGGGDAPYWSDVSLFSEIESEGFNSIKIERMGGEEDEDGNEIVEESKTDIHINITPNGFVIEK